MGWVVLAALVVVIGALLFLPWATLRATYRFADWASRGAKQRNARLGPKDVESALMSIVSPGDGYVTHDEWDMFLAWPIDDPYLESIRDRCISIAAQCWNPKEDIRQEGVKRVAALLEELRARTQVGRPDTGATL